MSKREGDRERKLMGNISGFFGPDAIRPFDPKDVENDLKEKKFKTKDLELAVRQALNPSLLTDLEEEDTSTKKKGKKKAETKKKDTPAATPTKRQSRNLNLEQDMVDEDIVKKRVSCYESLDGCKLTFFLKKKSASQCRLKRKMRAGIRLLLKVIRIKSPQNIKRYTISDTDYSVWYITRKRQVIHTHTRIERGSNIESPTG